MLVYSYNFASGGAKELSRALGARRIFHNSTTFIGRSRKRVINWGCSEIPREVLKCQIINRPEVVSRAADKLSFFRAMGHHGLTPFWTDTKEGAVWAMNEHKHSIVCRTVLSGHSGAGIVIANKPEELVNARLYVEYIPKSEEFRVHVCGNKVIDVQRKARRRDVPDNAINWQVRNHQNGFIYARGGMEEWPGLRQLQEAAIRTVQVLGLDFGAVDIIWNKKQDKYYVLEVNTAPGLEGETVHKYANAFKEL